MSDGTPMIVEATKILVPGPEWTLTKPALYEILFALDDLSGATIDGARVRLKAIDDLPEQAVMVQLEYPQSDRRDHAIDRINWKPIHDHCNQGKGPEEYRFIPFEGTHRHAFDLNWLPEEGRLLVKNLPVALPVRPDPATYQELLEFAGECFRINNLTAIEPPPWKEETLFPQLR
jgi:hypothetical protein